MGAAFLERANRVAEMKDSNDLLMAFPEVRRALPHLGLDAGRGAELVLSLYRRHADEVNKGVDVMLAWHAVALRKRKLPGDCLLWTVYAPNSVHVLPVLEPVRHTTRPARKISFPGILSAKNSGFGESGWMERKLWRKIAGRWNWLHGCY